LGKNDHAFVLVAEKFNVADALKVKWNLESEFD